MKTINAGIKLSGVTTDQANKVASGWATGGNGWRFAFSVSPGVIELDTRELTEYSAKADARQIRRELKKCFSHVFG